MFARNRIIGLDVGADSVKLVELKKTKDGLELVRARVTDIETEGLFSIKDEVEKTKVYKDLLKKAIARTLDAEKIRHSRAAIAVSGLSSFVRPVKLPKVAPKKIEQMAKYEAQQQVPFAIDEIIWNYQVLGETPEGEMNLILVAVKKDIIRNLIATVSNGLLSVEFVDITSLALYNALHFNQACEPGTVILDIGKETSNIILTTGEKAWTRSIPVAGDEITKALASDLGIALEEAERLKKAEGAVGPPCQSEEKISKAITRVLNDILVETTRSIEYYKLQKLDTRFNRFILTGGSSRIKGIGEFFQNSLNLEFQEPTLFRSIKIPASFTASGTGSTGLDKLKDIIGVAVGLALHTTADLDVKINLLPPEEKEAKELQTKSPYLLLSAALLILIVLSFSIFARQSATIDEERLEELDKKLIQYTCLKKKTDEMRSQIKPVQARLDLLENIVKGKGFWLERLARIADLVPPEVWLTHLSHADFKTLKIEGRTFGKYSVVGGFKKNLEDSGLFNKVELISAPEVEIIEETRVAFVRPHEKEPEARPRRGRDSIPRHKSIDKEGVVRRKKMMIKFTIQVELKGIDKLAAISGKVRGLTSFPKEMYKEGFEIPPPEEMLRRRTVPRGRR